MSFAIQGVSSSPFLLQTVSTAASVTVPSTASGTTDPFSNLNLTSTQQQQVQQVIQDLQSGTIAPSLAQSQINAILTPQQQQTLQTDLQQIKGAHHHHHGGGHHHHSSSTSTASSSASPLSQLDLTDSQETEIDGIVQAAQAGGTSPTDILRKINGILTTSQQQKLASLLSANGAPSASTSQTPSYLVNTSA